MPVPLVIPQRRNQQSLGRLQSPTLVLLTRSTAGDQSRRSQPRPVWRWQERHIRQSVLVVQGGRWGLVGGLSTGDSAVAGRLDCHCRCSEGWLMECRGSEEAGGTGEGGGGDWHLHWLNCQLQ